MTANDQWESLQTDPESMKCSHLFSMLGETRKDVVRRYILSQMVFTDMSSGHSILIGHLGPSPHFSLVQKISTITLGDTHTLLVSQMLLKLRSSENYEGNSQHTHVQITPV